MFYDLNLRDTVCIRKAFFCICRSKKDMFFNYLRFYCIFMLLLIDLKVLINLINLKMN